MSSHFFVLFNLCVLNLVVFFVSAVRCLVPNTFPFLTACIIKIWSILSSFTKHSKNHRNWCLNIDLNSVFKLPELLSYINSFISNWSAIKFFNDWQFYENFSRKKEEVQSNLFERFNVIHTNFHVRIVFTTFSHSFYNHRTVYPLWPSIILHSEGKPCRSKSARIAKSPFIVYRLSRHLVRNSTLNCD